MKYRIALTLLALCGLALGYYWTTQDAPGVAARSTTMPDNPHIVYLSPPDATHGRLTPQTVRDRGGVVWQRWEEVRAGARQRPLDALLVEERKFSELTEADRLWLREQIEEGVVLVGVGIDIEPFSAALGLPTLRAPGEALIPIGEDGYYMLIALLQGTPEDMAAMRAADWLAKSILDKPVQLDTKNPLGANIGGKREKLTTEQDVDGFFSELIRSIEYIYRSRTEFQSLQRTE